MTKEGKQALRVERYVFGLGDAIRARKHLTQESVLWFVLCPIFCLIALTCLCLLVADALGLIAPMRAGLLTAVTTVLTSGTVTTAASAGFGWLYDRNDAVAEEPS